MDLVHSQDPGASDRLNRFERGDADWLVSIDMCAEGFDAPRLRVVAYLTTVATRSRFIQGITRAVRLCSERANLEASPRDPSFVFAPADPLLMQYAQLPLSALSHCGSCQIRNARGVRDGRIMARAEPAPGSRR